MSCVNEKRTEKTKFSLVNSKKKNPGPTDLYTFFFFPQSDSKRMVCKHVIDCKDQYFKVHISWVTKKSLSFLTYCCGKLASLGQLSPGKVMC